MITVKRKKPSQMMIFKNFINTTYPSFLEKWIVWKSFVFFLLFIEVCSATLHF